MVRLKVQDHESIQTVKTLLQAEVGVARNRSYEVNFVPTGRGSTLSARVAGLEGGCSFSTHRCNPSKDFPTNLGFARSTVVVRDELAEGELPLPAHSRAAHSYSCNRRVRIFLLPENLTLDIQNN